MRRVISDHNLQVDPKTNPHPAWRLCAADGRSGIWAKPLFAVEITLSAFNFLKLSESSTTLRRADVFHFFADGALLLTFLTVLRTRLLVLRTGFARAQTAPLGVIRCAGCLRPDASLTILNARVRGLDALRSFQRAFFRTLLLCRTDRWKQRACQNKHWSNEITQPFLEHRKVLHRNYSTMKTALA